MPQSKAPQPPESTVQHCGNIRHQAKSDHHVRRGQRPRIVSARHGGASTYARLSYCDNPCTKRQPGPKLVFGLAGLGCVVFGWVELGSVVLGWLRLSWVAVFRVVLCWVAVVGVGVDWDVLGLVGLQWFSVGGGVL